MASPYLVNKNYSKHMRNLLIFCIFLPTLFFSFISKSIAQLYSLETKNLQLIYIGKSYAYVVPHAARCFENALRFHGRLFGYTPDEKVIVFLQDFWDYGNAGATAVPNNRIRFGIAPLSYAFETSPANERMNHTMNHELVHIFTMDKPSPTDRFFRSFFWGKVLPTSDNPLSMIYSYLTNPWVFSPRWYLEGIAVFFETWMAGGLGRALGPYDEMVFRTMVRDHVYIYDIVGLESEGTTIDFQVGVNSYLYGTRFISYLVYQYGIQKLLDWFNRTRDSKRYFSSQFKKVYGVSLDTEWSRWIRWEHQFQQTNLESIQSHPTTPYRRVSRKALGSVSRAFFDAEKKKIYAAINYPGQIAHIAAIDIQTGAIEKICDVKGAALYFVSSLVFDRSNNTIFFTTDNNRWRDLNAVNIETGKTQMLIKDARTGDLAFNQADKSIWGVRHYNGISTIVRIPYPYKEWNQVLSLPYGKDIFDIDISPDGQTLSAALAEISGKQLLIKMDIKKLLAGENSYNVLFDFEEYSPANFVFTPDGKYLFGTSYYSGVSNVYRYDLEKNDMDIISNCETGFFRPVPVSSDSLLIFRYTGKGFIPAMIPIQKPEHVSAIKFLGNEIIKKYPVLNSWIINSPSTINIDSLITYSGKYNSLQNIRMNSVYPIVEGYKDFAALGIRFNFSDRLTVSGFDFTASYTPVKALPTYERIHLGFNFHHWQWKIFGTYNGANFYDLFGPTKSSRKGYSLGVQYQKTLLYDQPKTMKLIVQIAQYGRLEKLPDYQNVNATFDKLLSGSIKLNYDYRRISLGAVDYEKGVKWQMILQNNYVNRNNFPRLFSNLDYGIPLPINHSSIWLRTSAGYSFGDRDDPFSNFFFGGFGNNWVDNSTEKRYREYYSFPGVELNEIGGINYGKVMFEWNFPPLRFRRFGIPALYFNWMRPALFTTGIRTNFTRHDNKKSSAPFSIRRTLFNLGGQLDFRLVMFSHLKLTFSLGYAAAFEKNRKTSTEFMISLKIL